MLFLLFDVALLVLAFYAGILVGRRLPKASD